MIAYEVNFDGLIGQTHHYGGLSAGNLASQQNKLLVSRPREAALQGLAKMKLLLDLGLKQGVFPPHERPHFGFLREQGFTGSEQQVIERAAKQRPDLLSIAYSASAMWAANAATVSPSADGPSMIDHVLNSGRPRVSFTVANLISTPHRKLEAEFTYQVLSRLFADQGRFQVGGPLRDEARFADEGAANQMRLCPSHAERGIEVGAYGGLNPLIPNAPTPQKYPIRQSFVATTKILFLHGSGSVWAVQQNPEAIDAGVFHNDVIAVANENVLLFHELAWHRQSEFLQGITAKYREQCEDDLCLIEVSRNELSLEDAVATYLFNSQLLTMPTSRIYESAATTSDHFLPPPATLHPSRSMLLLCPSECQTHPRARAVLDRILAEDNPIDEVQFIDVRQSMRNGGGPACLRLRVVLTAAELAAVQGHVLLTPALYDELTAWVTKHYREELTIADLADPHLVTEVRDALEELTGILDLPKLYPFQQA